MYKLVCTSFLHFYTCLTEVHPPIIAVYIIAPGYHIYTYGNNVFFLLYL